MSGQAEKIRAENFIKAWFEGSNRPLRISTFDSNHHSRIGLRTLVDEGKVIITGESIRPGVAL